MASQPRLTLCLTEEQIRALRILAAKRNYRSAQEMIIKLTLTDLEDARANGFKD